MRLPYFLRFDWLTLLTTAAIVGLGLPYLWSAASDWEFSRQLQWLAVGVAAMIVTTLVDYRFFLRWAFALYGIGVALLAFVLTQPAIKGARAWVRFGDIGLQPIEAFKCALLLALARWLSVSQHTHTVAGLAAPLALVLGPTALILQQPDLGGALTLWAPLFAVLFASGARVAHLAGLAAAGLAAAVPMWHFVMHDYMKRRVFAFLDPLGSGLSEAEHLNSSLMAIGSGRLLGQGLGQGTLNDLGMLPERHNDFIFAVVAEEGGLVAAGALLGLFALLALAGYRVANNTPEPGGRLLAVGVSTMLAAQAFLNVAVVTGCLPTTGVTLPFVSYGGSSLVMSLAMVGLVLNISTADPGVVWSESFLGRDRRRGEL